MLVPAGIYGLQKARLIEKKYLFIASLVFVFALQQLIEGLLWLALNDGKSEHVYLLAAAFLSFSHLIWLFLPQISAALLEDSAEKKRLFYGFALFGFLFGCSIYFPLLINDGWLTVKILNHSIVYEVNYIYEMIMPKGAVSLIYASLIFIPMLLSSNGHIRFFAIILLMSGVFSYTLFLYSFISVWCFFAAIISLYIVYIIYKTEAGP